MEFAERAMTFKEEPIEPIPIENFVIDLPDDRIKVIGNIIAMDGSCYIWLGAYDSLPSMGSLAMAMPTRFESDPLSSELIRSKSSTSSEMARRLSKRYKIQTFVSCDLPEIYEPHIASIDRRLIEILDKNFTKS